MTREQTYEAQMRALGIWQEAFRPAVKELADMERDRQRLKKRWRKEGCEVETEKGTAAPLYASICALRRDILAYKNALGLTPAGLKRVRALPAAEVRDAGKLTPLEIVRGKREKQA